MDSKNSNVDLMYYVITWKYSTQKKIAHRKLLMVWCAKICTVAIFLVQFLKDYLLILNLDFKISTYSRSLPMLTL